MKLLAWRLAMLLLTSVAAFLLAIPLERRRRITALLFVAALLVAAALVGMTRVSFAFVLSEFRSTASNLHWAILAQGLIVLTWLLAFSREPWPQRVVRIGAAAALVLGILTYDAVRFVRSGIQQEIAVSRLRSGTLPPALSSKRGDWPSWRGPSGNGHADETTSFAWTDEARILWATGVPGEGHSSPCVWGELVFLTTADANPPSQSVLAVDRDSGQERWRQTVHRATLGRKHEKNSYASATPCCDGRYVFAAFTNSSAAHLTALEMASGRVAWQRRLGDYAPSANLAASPILFEDLVIVAAEGVSDPFVAGAYRDTGDIAWRTRLRLEGESHTTPSVVPTQRGPELVLPTCWSIVGLDPRSGAARWSCPWGQQDSAASIALSATRIFAMGNSPIQEVLAVDISSPDEPHVLWRKTQGAGKVPSLLLAGQDLILVGDDGVAACLNPETGATVWRKRLGGQFSASPVLAGENVFAVNEDGKIFVFRTGREYQRVGTLDLGEPVFASPAICEGRLFVRSIRSLFCVASPTN